MTEIVYDPIVGLPPTMLDASRPPEWSDLMHTWVVYSNTDVHKVLLAPKTVISAAFVPPGLHPAFDFMWASDPPRHDTLRGAAKDQFRAPVVERDYADPIRRIANELLDEEAIDGQLNVARWAMRLANRVACLVLGIDADLNEARIERWLTEAGDAETQPQAPNGPEITAWAQGLIEERRDAGDFGPGLLGHLLALQASGYTITDQDIRGYIWGLFAAGTVTTGVQITSVALHLAPQGLLRNAGAVEEVLRLDPAFPMTRRVTVIDLPVAYGTVVIPAGQPVTVCLASANRDPDVFDRPHELDPGRTPNPHRTFGAGIHFCLGEHLARLEILIAADVLAGRLVGLAVDPYRPPVRRLGIVHQFVEAHMVYLGGRIYLP